MALVTLLYLHVVQVAAHFGASWCVTSLSMNYKFEELAQTHPDMLFLFVDVDDVPVTNHSFPQLFSHHGLLLFTYFKASHHSSTTRFISLNFLLTKQIGATYSIK